jgi:hypothetical protein
MLGRVAVVRGDLERAETELLAAARVPGSPQLASFGPNMQLVLELLQAGRKECVLEYFALCEKFWERDKGSCIPGPMTLRVGDNLCLVEICFISGTVEAA